MWTDKKKIPAVWYVVWLVVQLLCGCSAKSDTLSLERALEEERREGSAAEATDDVFPAEEQAEAGAQDAVIYVHVCGAVVSPGVVTIPPGSRAKEAIEAAGGFTPQADCNYVNLAALITDGEQLYVPVIGESPRMTEQDLTGLVNLNTAELKELCTLPGIGESRAADIIAYRQENGAFTCTEDIMKVSGIKESTYDKLKDLITVR